MFVAWFSQWSKDYRPWFGRRVQLHLRFWWSSWQLISSQKWVGIYLTLGMHGVATACFVIWIALMITRATESQWSKIFSALSKADETSRNQISLSYHEGIPSYQVKQARIYNCQNLLLGHTFVAAQFFSLHRYFIETTTTDIEFVIL